jgi:hypothetical protein
MYPIWDHLNSVLKMAIFWGVAQCSLKFTDVTEVLDASIITLMMKAARTSETSVKFHQTTLRNNPQDSHLHTRRRENLKSHLTPYCLIS